MTMSARTLVAIVDDVGPGKKGQRGVEAFRAEKADDGIDFCRDHGMGGAHAGIGVAGLGRLDYAGRTVAGGLLIGLDAFAQLIAENGEGCPFRSARRRRC